MKDGVAHVQAGGGIVYDSVPERERQETVNKQGAADGHRPRGAGRGAGAPRSLGY